MALEPERPSCWYSCLCKMPLVKIQGNVFYCRRCKKHLIVCGMSLVSLFKEGEIWSILKAITFLAKMARMRGYVV